MSGDTKLAMAKAKALSKLHEERFNVELSDVEEKLIEAKAKAFENLRNQKEVKEQPVKQEKPKTILKKSKSNFVEGIIQINSVSFSKERKSIVNKITKTEEKTLSETEKAFHMQINSLKDRLAIAENNALTHPSYEMRKSAQDESSYLRASIGQKEDRLRKHQKSNRL